MESLLKSVAMKMLCSLLLVGIIFSMWLPLTSDFIPVGVSVWIALCVWILSVAFILKSAGMNILSALLVSVVILALWIPPTMDLIPIVVSFSAVLFALMLFVAYEYPYHFIFSLIANVCFSTLAYTISVWLFPLSQENYFMAVTVIIASFILGGYLAVHVRSRGHLRQKELFRESLRLSVMGRLIMRRH